MTRKKPKGNVCFIFRVPHASGSSAKFIVNEDNNYSPSCFHMSRCVAVNPFFIAFITRVVSPERKPFCFFTLSHKCSLAKMAASLPPWPSKTAKNACSGSRSNTTRLKSSISFRPPWFAWPFTRTIIFLLFVFLDMLIVSSSASQQHCLLGRTNLGEEFVICPLS